MAGGECKEVSLRKLLIHKTQAASRVSAGLLVAADTGVPKLIGNGGGYR